MTDPVAATKPSDTRFYSVAETAALLRVSKMSVYRAIADGDIPAIRIRSRLIVPAAFVDRIADA